MKKILFTGGGSAGHVVPNIALIEDLLKEGKVQVGYMGTNGIEKSIVAPYKIPYMQITCPKLIRGKSFSAFKQNATIPFAFLKAVKEAKIHLRTFSPDLVFSKGGYVGLPVLFAAKSLHIPCLAHESDFSLGLANKLSAKKCKYLFTSFPETAEKLSNGKYSGAPMRSSLFEFSKNKAREQFGFSKKDKVLLVFGGGSGSAAINDAVRANLKTLTKNYAILHICGKGNLVQSRIKNYQQAEYIADMGKAYACADAVLCRAGAGTVFEMLALKKPSLLVPLSGQTRGDQKENAEYFRKKGLCRVLPQENLDALPTEVEKLFQDGELREKLDECGFLRGNENILREMKKLLYE